MPLPPLSASESATLRAILAEYVDGPPLTRVVSLAVETTGLDRDDVLVGCTVLCGGTVRHVLVDWLRPGPGYHVAPTWLERRLREVREAAQQRQTRYDLSIDRLRLEGLAPRDAADQLIPLLEDLGVGAALLCNYLPVLGVLESSLSSALGLSRGSGWRIPDFETVLDLVTVEKAVQLGMAPHAGEHFGDFYQRVTRARAPEDVRWGLHGWCRRRYALEDACLAETGQRLDSWPPAETTCRALQYLFAAYLAAGGGPS